LADCLSRKRIPLKRSGTKGIQEQGDRAVRSGMSGSLLQVPSKKDHGGIEEMLSRPSFPRRRLRIRNCDLCIHDRLFPGVACSAWRLGQGLEMPSQLLDTGQVTG